MENDRFFVTGATGCIGSWVLKNLIDRDIPTAILDLGDSRHRLRLIMDDDDLDKISFFNGDITDYSSLLNSIEKSGSTKIIHLAALQLPFCRADPRKGAKVNISGTINIFEAAKSIGIKKVVYASSAAVYGLKEFYPAGPLAHDADLHPLSLYGVYKQANEGFGEVYRIENNVFSIGLRPNVVYGPGRDQGMTSTPTKAILAALVGEPYKITFGGEYEFQFADDVAKIFIQAAESSIEGSGAFNIGGPARSTQEILDAIIEIIPESKSKLSFDPTALPFPASFDNSELLSTIGDFSFTPLSEGIEGTLEVFKKGIKNGIIDSKYINSQLGL